MGGARKPDTNKDLKGERERERERERDRERERERERKSDVMASFPRAGSSSRQPPGPQDEDPNLDEYDLYSLAHSYLGKAWP